MNTRSILKQLPDSFFFKKLHFMYSFWSPEKAEPAGGNFPGHVEVATLTNDTNGQAFVKVQLAWSMGVGFGRNIYNHLYIYFLVIPPLYQVIYS